MQTLIQRLRSSPQQALLLALSLAFVGVVYFPLTRIYFNGDDFIHLAEIADRGFPHFLLRPWAGHLYLARNTFFYIPYWLFGFRPEPYAWIGFALHLINSALLFRFIRNLTDSAPLGALGAAMWGTCLLHSGALGWFAVHGLAFACTALLFVLARLTDHSEQDALSPRAALLFMVVLWIGATCFGVGTGVAIAAPVVIALMVPSAYRTRSARFAFLALPFLVLATYLAVPWIYGRVYGPVPLTARVVTPFALGVAFDFWPVIVMLGALLRVGIVGILWGASFVPNQDPVTPAWGTFGAYLLVIAGALVVADGPTRRKMLGLVVLGAAAYGIIGVGRASLFGLAGVIEGAKASRYHYIGTIPLVVLLIVSIGQAARVTRLPTALPVATLTAWAAFEIYAFFTKTWSIEEYKPCRALVASARKAIDAQVDAQPPGSDVKLQNAPLDMCGWGLKASDLFVITHPENEVRGRHVHFFGTSTELRHFRSPEHRRMSTLLVLPEGVPPETPDPRAASVRTASAACSQVKALYDRMRLKLGCSTDDWATWGKICRDIFPGPTCSQEIAATLSCLEANSAGSFYCNQNGTLGVNRGPCDPRLNAFVDCASW